MSPTKRSAVDNLDMIRIWSGKRDSNSRPRPWQGRALPTELFPLGWSVPYSTFKFWSGKRDSNSRPRPWQGRALPTELFPLGWSVPYSTFKFWSGKRDSNSRPRPWQGRALPTELFPQICTAFVAVVTRISLSLREAHYTRNPFSCNPPKSVFCEIQFK